MKNAHLRMGSLQFTKMLLDTTIDITLRMDRMIAEDDADNRSARCHLLSVIGNDQEVAAIAAAIADEARFYASGPDVNLAHDHAWQRRPKCFRSSHEHSGPERRPLLLPPGLRSPKNCQTRVRWAAIRLHAEPFFVMTIEELSCSTGSARDLAFRFYRSGASGSGKCWNTRIRLNR